MKSMKKPIFIAITLIIVGLLTSSVISVTADEENEKNKLNQLNIKKIDSVEIKLEQNRAPVEIPVKQKKAVLGGNPEFNYEFDQYHPAFGKSEYLGYMAAYRNEEVGTISWTNTPDNYIYYDIPGGDYPSIKLWDDTRFFGTFVPDAQDSYGGIVYLFETDYPDDLEGYALSGWDWSDLPDYPGEILWHDILDIEIACDNSKEDWEWGFISFVGSTSYGEGVDNGPFITYQTSSDGYATISWYLIEGCEHTDNVIDHETYEAYAAYDLYSTEDTAPYYGLFIRKDYYDDWDAEGTGYVYTTEGNLKYPAISAFDDNIIVLAEADENGNKDIICFYGSDLDNLQTSFAVETEDDEMYPDIRHVEGTTFIATYIRNGNLYAIKTDNAGETWGEPRQINDNNGEVVEEYKTSDLSEKGLLAMWTETDIDQDIWMGVAIDNNPPETPLIDGPDKGNPETEYTFTFTTTESEGEDVEYFVDWGDGALTGWRGPYAHNAEASFSHTWYQEDTFTIRAKARDTNGLESNWGTFEIDTPKSRYDQKSFIEYLFERLLNQFPILKQIFTWVLI